MNEAKNCLGLLLVHHAISKSLTSRPPYADQGPVRGKRAVEENSMAAVACLYLHAVMSTVSGETENFEPTTKMIRNPVIAYCMGMYCLKRWHQWDSRPPVMFQKAMIASDPKQLDPKFGLEQTYKNKRERGKAFGYNKAVRIAQLLTNYQENNKEPMKEAIKILRTSTDGMHDLMNNGDNTGILVAMSRVLKDVLHEDGDLFGELLEGIEKEIDEMRSNAEQEDTKKKEAFDSKLKGVKAEEAEDTGDGKGKQHENLQSQSTKPKRRKR